MDKEAGVWEVCQLREGGRKGREPPFSGLGEALLVQEGLLGRAGKGKTEGRGTMRNTPGQWNPRGAILGPLVANYGRKAGVKKKKEEN